LLKGISDGILEQLFGSVPKDYPQYVVENSEQAVAMAIKLAQAKLNKDKTIQEDNK
jgi:hypothetical protein